MTNNDLEVRPLSPPHVLAVPEAGRKYFGIGRSAAYEAARRGEIPTIRIGRKLFVPIAAIERLLAETTCHPREDRQ